MNVLEALRSAIENRTPISFEYVRPQKQPGRRYGHPHAVFVLHKNDGTKGTYLDLWQVSGVTDSGDLPEWRQFFVDDVRDIRVESGSPFEVAEDYKPQSDRYRFALHQV